MHCTHTDRKQQQLVRKLLTENRKLKRKLLQQERKFRVRETKLKPKIDELALQLTKLTNQKDVTAQQVINNASRDAESADKKLKTIHDLKDTNQELHKQVIEKEEIIQVTNELLETARTERRAALQDLSQVRIRAKSKECSIIARNDEKIKQLKAKIDESDTQIRELQQLNVLLENDMIKTFEGGKFVNEMRETIMILLTECNVSMSKVGSVITTVCKNLLGKIPEKLPSKGTLHRILNEAKFVAQTQVYQCLEEGGDPSAFTGNTLHSDATTKFHHHYQGFQATLLDGKQISIGLIEVGAGDYFCKMHLLVNFATEADKVLQINEADIVADGRNQFAMGNESGAARLIRTSCKALTEHGCDMSGMASHWLTYLEEQNIKNHLISYRANRFNVLFYDAAATYYHRNHISDFISSLPDPNNLLKAVLFYINHKVYLAQIRALGIIDKVVTGPFWRLVEAAPNILSLNDPLNHMLTKLKAWAVNASPILEQAPLFPDIDIHNDDMYDELFQESDDADFCTYTQVALEMILTGIVLILERQAKDQLEGGKYFAPSNSLLHSSKNVPTTNTVSERDFAILDVLVRLKPAASCHSLETYILWCNNKPSEWLETMDAHEKTKLLDMARGRYGAIREQYIKRKEILKQQHRQSLKARQNKKEKQEQRSRISKVAATDGIVQYGGVWTLESFAEKVEEIEPSMRKSAIYAQLKYHRKVLNSKGHHTLFNKTSHGVAFPEDKLKENLKNVLELNEITTANVQSAHLQYHTPDETQKNVQSSKTKMLEKISMQRKQLKAKQQQILLPQFLEDPDSLVGKRVTHRCREEDGTVEWFSGTVKDICQIKPNVINTEYDLQYDDFPDVWTFPLLMDLKKGDLIIKL